MCNKYIYVFVWQPFNCHCWCGARGTEGGPVGTVAGGKGTVGGQGEEPWQQGLRVRGPWRPGRGPGLGCSYTVPAAEKLCPTPQLPLQVQPGNSKTMRLFFCASHGKKLYNMGFLAGRKSQDSLPKKCFSSHGQYYGTRFTFLRTGPCTTFPLTVYYRRETWWSKTYLLRGNELHNFPLGPLTPKLQPVRVCMCTSHTHTNVSLSPQQARVLLSLPHIGHLHSIQFVHEPKVAPTYPHHDDGHWQV